MNTKDGEFRFTIGSIPSGEHQRAMTVSEAEEFFLKRLEEDGGRNARNLNQLFEFYIHSHQPDKASSCAARLMEATTDPEERGRLRVRLGCVAEQMDDFAAAETWYREALEFGVPDPQTEYWAYNNLGYCLNRLGRPAEAEPYLHHAVALDATRSNAFKNLGLCYQGLGRFADAAESFMRATRTNATDDRSLVHLKDLVGDHPELYDQVPGLEEGIQMCMAAVEFARAAQPDFGEWWRRRRAEQDKRTADEGQP
jgi:tetratricopeptide (TPR) repeat protein